MIWSESTLKNIQHFLIFNFYSISTSKHIRYPELNPKYGESLSNLLDEHYDFDGKISLKNVKLLQNVKNFSLGLLH